MRTTGFTHRARIFSLGIVFPTVLASSPVAAGTTEELIATKVDAVVVDVDGDGEVDPGDTVRYTIVVDNVGDATAIDTRLDDTPDPSSSLVVGSVTTDAGRVTLGNTAGDVAVQVAMGSIPPAGSAPVTVTFDVVVDDPFTAPVLEIANQGMVEADPIIPGGRSRGTVVLTDDPATPAPDDPTVTPVDLDPSLTATKVDTLLIDLDDDGRVDFGDTIRYTISVSNAGPGDALGTMLDDSPDPGTALVVGSVSADQGVVTVGNTPGDTAVVVDLGTVAAGEAASIEFDVVVDPALPPEVTSVANQGTVTADGEAPRVTDDPAQPGTDDPTVTAVEAPEPVVIPTLGSALLLVFALLLAAAGLHALRR